MYARRRFQGLSLEQQRQLQRTKKGRFRRRRSTATTASRPSIPSSIQSNSDPRKSRVRKENPFKLQVRLYKCGVVYTDDPLVFNSRTLYPPEASGLWVLLDNSSMLTWLKTLIQLATCRAENIIISYLFALLSFIIMSMCLSQLAIENHLESSSH